MNMVTLAMRGLCVALLLESSTALRSCTRAVVPCEDALRVEPHDRFLVTLFGHSCYSIHVASTQALDVYFYDASDWTRPTRPLTARSLRAIPPHGVAIPTDVVKDWAENMQVCRDTIDCRMRQTNRSAHALYDLVIARSAQDTEPSTSQVQLRIETCDTLSMWFYVGLMATALGGFFTMLFLLCVVSEYLLGIHAYTRLRRKLGWRSGYAYQIVELAQCDRDAEDSLGGGKRPSCHTKKPRASFALSATAEPSEFSDDDDQAHEDKLQPSLLVRNHADATSHTAAMEA